MRVYGCLFVLILCTSYSLNSYALDGNKLHSQAIEYQKWERGQHFDILFFGEYVGFIAGASDATFKKGIYCSPSDITYVQSNAIVANYLEKHPEKWNQPAVDIVVQAMQEVYPCSK
jgi:hypothetical protein